MFCPCHQQRVWNSAQGPWGLQLTVFLAFPTSEQQKECKEGLTVAVVFPIGFIITSTKQMYFLVQNTKKEGAYIYFSLIALNHFQVQTDNLEFMASRLP